MLLFIVYSRGLVVPRKPCHLQIPVSELHVVVFTLDPAASMCRAVKFGSTRRRFRRLRRWDIFHSVLVSDFRSLKKSEDEQLGIFKWNTKDVFFLGGWKRNRRSYDPRSQFPNLLHGDLIVERYFVLLIFGLLKSSSNPGSFAENESVVVSLTILEAGTGLNRK